jgi:hypothetical protein
MDNQTLSESITQLTDEKNILEQQDPNSLALIVNQNKQLVQRIKDTASQLNTGHRSEFYMEQNEMFMVLPRIIFYVLYGIVYILFAYFIIYGLGDNKSGSNFVAKSWTLRIALLVVFFFYVFVYDIVLTLLGKGGSYFKRYDLLQI